MRRPGRWSLLAALAVVVIVASAPAWGAASGPPSWVGVYGGTATGRAVGTTKSAAAIVFVTQEGEGVRFLVQVAGYSVTARGVPRRIDTDTVDVPFTVDDGEVQGSGEAMLERNGGAWTLSVTADGTAYGLSGEGGLVAQRRKTRMSGLTEQVTGTLKAVAGSQDISHVPTPAEGPGSVVGPPEPTAPVDTKDTAVTWGLIVLVVILSILLA
jgi:hypothetical protein